jgi:hypothetical protein
MRMYENFSGNRVLSYCLMCNHITSAGGNHADAAGRALTDEELLGRLKWIQREAQVALVAKELAEAQAGGGGRRAKDGDAWWRQDS